MKRTIRIVLLAAAAGTGLVWAARVNAKPPTGTLRFRDYSEGMIAGGVRDLAAPLRTRERLPSTPRVTSKWNQPRDQGTTPHQGVDLEAVLGTAVYPVAPGWIVYQHGKRPGGTCCHEDQPDMGRWEMLIRLDWNANGRQDDNVYLKYDHLERVGFAPTGAWVTTADQVATSGNEGGSYAAHLHFGLLFPRESGRTTGRWASMEPHYRWVDAWRGGTDLDFISRVGWRAGNVVEATAYVMNNGTRVSLPAGNVSLFHRPAGGGAWAQGTMEPGSRPNVYRIDLDGLGYAPGTSIRWMVGATRPNLREPHARSFYPPGPDHADSDPNAVSFEYPSYPAVTQ